jgi:hypothetical protein
MKRCPQCEFIYEDDQSVCDMDGQSLAHDHALSVIQPRASAQTKVARPSSLNGIALPAGAGLLLALAIFIGYTASPSSLQTKTEGATAQPTTRRFDTGSPHQNNLYIQSTGSVSALESAPPEPSEQVTTTKPERNSIVDKTAHARLEKGDERFPIARSVPPLPRLRPLPRLPEAKPLEKKSNATGIGRNPERPRQPKLESATTGKKDSKFGSFLKKTGRVLSKPFRL